ncbi:MAG TPA: tRNA pseudouridine(38-40) synthase TruA [Ktedonobacterales bacterium]
MRTLAALVAYDGTPFKGFQRQSAEKGPTVQGALEAVIARIAGEAIAIEAAGRTDRGVHATGQVVSFQTAARHDPATWQRALNALLPAEIAIRALCEAPPAFRARRSALARRYRYRLFSDPVRAPLRERYAWRLAAPLNVAAMDAAATSLLGEHDFGAFGASPRDDRATGYRGHTVRTLLEARCRPVGAEEIACDFAANAFLTGMVRRLAGTLALVGQGRLSLAELRGILAARDRAHPGTPAPTAGLCLVGVDYPAGMLAW